MLPATERILLGPGPSLISPRVMRAPGAPMLSHLVTVPHGVDEAAVRRHLFQRFNIEIGAGLGPLAGKIWRIGFMGASSTEALVTLCLSALTHALKETPVRTVSH